MSARPGPYGGQPARVVPTVITNKPVFNFDQTCEFAKWNNVVSARWNSTELCLRLRPKNTGSL
jgi:hypothetical protein